MIIKSISAYCMLFFFLFYWAVLFWWCTNDAHHPVWRWTFDEQWRWTNPVWWCTSPNLVVHITLFSGSYHSVWWCTVVHITQFGGAHHPVWWWTSTCLVVNIDLFGGAHHPVWPTKYSLRVLPHQETFFLVRFVLYHQIFVFIVFSTSKLLSHYNCPLFKFLCFYPRFSYVYTASTLDSLMCMQPIP